MDRDREYLADILQSAQLAITYATGVSRDSFLADTKLQDAVVRRIEIIGEAAKRLSDATRNAIPRVPWKQVMGMRDVLIHDYGKVDIPRVWDTLQAGLPPLIAELESYIQRNAGT